MTEIQIINEKNGNPFVYHNSINGRWARHYEKQEDVNSVILNLIKIINTRKNNCLEIGAGRNLLPSQAMSEIFEEVNTLDADWGVSHTFLPKLEDIEKLKNEVGKEMMIPSIRGKTGKVKSCLGDLALIRDNNSQLNNQLFDLVYFWGSIQTDGICSSISCSDSPLELGIDIPYATRILAPLNVIKNDGKILAVNGYFNQYQEELISNISRLNCSSLYLVLYWAFGSDKKASKIKIIGQSLESTLEHVKDLEGMERGYSKEQFDDLIRSDIIERLIKTGRYSFFIGDQFTKENRGKQKDYSPLIKIYGQLSLEDKKGIASLGIIDAIAVEF